MKLSFTIDTITFLALVLLTLLCWIGFEYYHRQNNFEIDPVLVENSVTPLPDSFDVLTLKKHYVGKDNFYEVPEDESTSQN